ncbi:hypothetical protein TRFO_28955 [Tritrichomonas foetus]|uniref:Uncharacterized protein n=1 Tax=Tritrichomonas foetus TaxID=1144522 RepID=A0A1J4K1K5_9EUKA|nr:hypothetical protein TRFO_28955 [Tritrichomonas foetus]|eukprot:OHT03630.1 hypothetical protein TRFO_28955 [Tritrichomonas foetus]
MESFRFNFPNGDTYSTEINPSTKIGDFADNLRDILFKTDDFNSYENDNIDKNKRVKLFYCGTFLSNDYSFSEINYSQNYPISVYIRKTPLAEKIQYSKLDDKFTLEGENKKSGPRKRNFTEEEAEDKTLDEDNKIVNQITPGEFQKIRQITPENFSWEMMVLFYLEKEKNMNKVYDYFRNIPSY